MSSPTLHRIFHASMYLRECLLHPSIVAPPALFYPTHLRHQHHQLLQNNFPAFASPDSRPESAAPARVPFDSGCEGDLNLCPEETARRVEAAGAKLFKRTTFSLRLRRCFHLRQLLSRYHPHHRDPIGLWLRDDDHSNFLVLRLGPRQGHDLRRRRLHQGRHHRLKDSFLQREISCSRRRITGFNRPSRDPQAWHLQIIFRRRRLRPSTGSSSAKTASLAPMPALSQSCPSFPRKSF